MATEYASPYIDTVGELRAFLAAFTDECPVRGDLRLAFTLDLERGSFVTAHAGSDFGSAPSGTEDAA